ncbi:UDP-N-acetylglucosamine--undecaprenyl-phosphate N-acetylglucosaminephosphotransferase [Vibrio sp. JC009]|uniref:UDP-N-acetylglucosamine--undecaprenyl-phosphate N-acetylglucosaminephosphotransferase n=1 Tax=Vibrio sp. JC009 TaxID=2912314 RepID=UPI0023B1147E|nr:UDP-N-acetylglucosamine--undecaprenyl-phosphate N-acetylglucosaminephosphotransferase [Vibrio sp. JC009]WED24170.1 UDP-N-acetylglucosamine--undecaprenyl-phosphate N-acetylglucosaminephosphotransferase [Vibrio sp. JC009]
MFTTIFLLLVISTSAMLSMRRVAIKFDFVDKPTSRKLHEGDIPLVGGISLFFSISFLLLWQPTLLPGAMDYLACTAVLVTVGAIDDKIELGAKFRLGVLIALSVWLTVSHKSNLAHLGDLFGFGSIELALGKELFTVLAVIACITAFNMSDGLDGLLGGLSAVTLLSLGYFFYHAGQLQLSYFCLFFVVAMTPYVLFNLDLIPNRALKIFMGDSGSYLIGFTVIWLLVEASQYLSPLTHQLSLRPVTALWITAVPVMDMVMVMMRRIGKKQSPLKADRLHLHHIFQRVGLSSHQTLLIIVTFAAACAGFGILGELYFISEPVMLYLFVSLFACYFWAMKKIWKLTAWFRKWQTDSGLTESSENISS